MNKEALMEEMVIRMVGNKLVFEVPLAEVLEAVAANGRLALEISSAQVIQAVRDAAAKTPVAQPAGKPGSKPGPKPAAQGAATAG
jgi:hypothetical protein